VGLPRRVQIRNELMEMYVCSSLEGKGSQRGFFFLFFSLSPSFLFWITYRVIFRIRLFSWITIKLTLKFVGLASMRTGGINLSKEKRSPVGLSENERQSSPLCCFKNIEFRLLPKHFLCFFSFFCTRSEGKLIRIERLASAR